MLERRQQREPSQQSPSPPPATADPVTTVLTKIPGQQGDTGAFLITFGVSYLAVDLLAVGALLPPPVTTAALASGVVVGVKNAIQAYLSRYKDLQAKRRLLQERSGAFLEIMRDDPYPQSAQFEGRLRQAQDFWDRRIDSDDVYEKTLDALIDEYKRDRGFYTSKEP